MRKANVKDYFALVRILTKAGAKEIYDSIKLHQKDDDIEKLGFEFIFDVMTKLTTREIEADLYECLAEPFCMTSIEVSELNPITFYESLVYCFDLKTLVNFFLRVDS